MITLDEAFPPGPLDQRVARVAGGLHALGVRRGDGVAWQRANSDDVVMLYRACWRLGAVAVPIHHLAGPTEVATIVDGTQPVVVVDDELPDGAAVTASSAEPDDVAVVLHTSGSSGTPKGVRHTQGRLAYKARLMADVHGLTADDALLMPAPLAHISGLLNAVLVAGVVPLRATIMMPKWDPDAALDIIERERITFMIGPPTFFLGLMGAASFSPERVESLRLVSSGGAGVTPAFVERASRELGCLVKRTYGSTEAPTMTTSFAGDDPERALTTDGRPVGDVELRIDPTNGELLVRGTELFVGYTDPARTAEAFTSDGFFRTGDVGVIDDGGWLTITGRIKDIIIRGGENISAAEVEAALEAHPSVHQAVAVGEPDERFGERVVAVVVADASFDLAACRAHFADRGIAKFKTPERVVVTDSLPLLPSGKPDREAIRRQVRGDDKGRA